MRVSSIDLGLLTATLGLALASGCSLGDAATGPIGEDTEGGTSGEPGSDEEAGLGSGVDETGTDGAGTSGVPPSDTSGSDGDETGTSETCDVYCGEGGSCELDEHGTPYCACIDGYAAYGLRCLPCAPSDGVYDVDVSLVVVSAEFLLDGGAFPVSAYQRAEILLRDPASGDEIVLGDTRNGGGEVSVLPGTYEVHYAWKGGDQLPVNRGAKVSTVEIPDAPTYELTVDVPVTQLSGSIKFNGAAPPNSPYDNGTILLVDPATGDEAPLGETLTGEYQASVIPGTYRVHYRRKVTNGQAPANEDAYFAERTVLDAESEQTFDVEVPVANLSGSFTLDDQTPPASPYENARIVLRSTYNGDEVVLGTTANGDYQAPVIAGTYQVIYERLTGGEQIPVNRAALLEERTIGGGPQTLDVNVATAVVSGGITVGGQTPPANPGDDGVVLLRNPQTGDEVLLGNTATGAYTQIVVQGTYDLYYRQETSSGGVPVNTNARLQADVQVEGGASLDVDVPVVTVSASVTVDGAPPPASVYDDGVLYLLNLETGDSVLLGNTRLAALERPVVPGTYELHYVVEAAGPTMPINAQSRLDTIEVGPSTALAVDIPVAVLQGATTLDTQPPPQSIYNRAALLLHDVGTEDVVYLGQFEAGSFARTLTAGTYVVVYQALATTGLLPANTNAGVACIELGGG